MGRRTKVDAPPEGSGMNVVGEVEGEGNSMEREDAASYGKLEEVEEAGVFKSEVDVFYSEVLSTMSAVSGDCSSDDSSVAAVKLPRQSSIPEESDICSESAEDGENESLAAVSFSAETELIANLSGSVKASSSHSSSSSTVEETETDFADPDYARLEHLAEPVIEARRIARLQRDQRRAELISLHHPDVARQQQKRVRFSFAGGVPRLEKYAPMANMTKTQMVLITVIVVFFALSVGLLVFIVKAAKDRRSGSSLNASANFPTEAPSVVSIEDSVIIDDFPEYMDPILASQLDRSVPTMSPVSAGLLRGSSTTAPSPSTCPDFPSPPPFPGKKGAALTLRALNEEGSWIENLPKILKLDPYWNYNWGLNRIGAQPNDIEFVPMVWGGYQSGELQQNLLEQVLPQIENGNVKRLLAFNEPDQPHQANLAVSKALDIWPQLELIGLPLIGPSCARPEDAWMEEFMSNVTESCHRVDWVGVHWYGAPNFDSFQSTMTRLYETYDRRPLVLTEFAPADWNATSIEEHRYTPAEVLDFMQTALPWMEQQAWIAGYVWYSFDETSPRGTSSALFDLEGQLTPLGRYYASVRNDTPLGDQSIQINY